MNAKCKECGYVTPILPPYEDSWPEKIKQSMLMCPVCGSKNIELVVKQKKIGRNQPCHCGSGKKFKKCHGKN